MIILIELTHSLTHSLTQGADAGFLKEIDAENGGRGTSFGPNIKMQAYRAYIVGQPGRGGV